MSNTNTAATGAGANVAPAPGLGVAANPLPDAVCTPPEMRLLKDVGQYLQGYARERPEVAALWCFGIGFVLGWRLKPW